MRCSKLGRPAGGLVFFFRKVYTACNPRYVVPAGNQFFAVRRVAMGLCLHVFDGELGGDDDPEEVAECDVGHYSDFGCFRDTIARHLDARLYPTLMEHSDCDGEWSLAEIPTLERELSEIANRFKGVAARRTSERI
jgi:hypothetical protein